MEKYLRELPGVSAKLAKTLANKITERDIDNLKKFPIEDKKNAAIVKALPKEAIFDIKWGFCRKIGIGQAAAIIAALPLGLTPVGSFRRRSAILGDIDLITTVPLDLAEEAIKCAENAQKCVGGVPELFKAHLIDGGELRRSFALQLGARLATRNCKTVKVDIFKVNNDAWPFALLHHTGSKEFNIRVRAHAKRELGLTLNQYGLFDSGGKPVENTNTADGKFHTERDVLNFLGVTWLEPKDRAK